MIERRVYWPTVLWETSLLVWTMVIIITCYATDLDRQELVMLYLPEVVLIMSGHWAAPSRAR